MKFLVAIILTMFFTPVAVHADSAVSRLGKNALLSLKAIIPAAQLVAKDVMVTEHASGGATWRLANKDAAVTEHAFRRASPQVAA